MEKRITVKTVDQQKYEEEKKKIKRVRTRARRAAWSEEEKERYLQKTRERREKERDKSFTFALEAAGERDEALRSQPLTKEERARAAQIYYKKVPSRFWEPSEEYKRKDKARRERSESDQRTLEDAGLRTHPGTSLSDRERVVAAWMQDLPVPRDVLTLGNSMRRDKAKGVSLPEEQVKYPGARSLEQQQPKFDSTASDVNQINRPKTSSEDAELVEYDDEAFDRELETANWDLKYHGLVVMDDEAYERAIAALDPDRNYQSFRLSPTLAPQPSQASGLPRYEAPSLSDSSQAPFLGPGVGASGHAAGLGGPPGSGFGGSSAYEGSLQSHHQPLPLLHSGDPYSHHQQPQHGFQPQQQTNYTSAARQGAIPSKRSLYHEGGTSKNGRSTDKKQRKSHY